MREEEEPEQLLRARLIGNMVVLFTTIKFSRGTRDLPFSSFRVLTLTFHELDFLMWELRNVQ